MNRKINAKTTSPLLTALYCRLKCYNRRTGKEREPIDKAYYICQTYNRLGKMPAQAKKSKREIYITLCFRTYRKLRLWH